MLSISIIILLISILIFCVGVYNITHVHEVNENIDKQNQELQKEHQRITEKINTVKNEFFKENQNYNDLKQKVSTAQQELLSTRNHLNDIQNTVTKTVDSQKELSQKAFENYCEVLEKQYEDYEKEYDMYKDALETSYSNRQLELMRELDETQKDLDKIKATRAAAIQAQLKEKEIKEKLSFYCLTLKSTELDDIKVLERMKNQLHEPRILSMLIWKTYFQKPMTSLCNNIVGPVEKSGIYKITNQKDNLCYIGQARDIADRWKQHAKCGLGIDTPAGNKLYKAMQEDGLWNFSFEVLEFCPIAQLNEKEKYYIELYSAKDFGYNITSGNSK